MATHFSKPVLCAATSSFAFFLKSLPVGRVGKVTYGKMWLWSLAPNMLASQDFGAKSTKLREVLQLKLVALLLAKDTRSGYHFSCVMEAGGGKGAAANPTQSFPVLQASPLCLLSHLGLFGCFSQSRACQSSETNCDLSQACVIDHTSERSTVCGKKMCCSTLIHGAHSSCKRMDMCNNSYCST